MLLGQVIFVLGILVGLYALVLFRRDASEVGSKYLAVSLGVTGLGAFLIGVLGD